mgnify:CR=1 FL=1
MDQSEVLRLEKAVDDFALVPKTLVFFSTAGLPKTAGKAELQFASGNFATLQAPQRVGPVVMFPSRAGELVYHALRGGYQFLVEVDGRAYFGGTDDSDESVFLVEVTKEATQAFSDDGEAGFYASLKPKELKKLEEGNPRGETRRQGDIFAFWCPAFGKSLHSVVHDDIQEINNWYGETVIKVVDSDSIQFQGTRHAVKGRAAHISWKAKNGAEASDTYYVGEMHAPDHKPLVFGNRPHRLFQAANVVRPRPGCGDR